MDTRVAAAVSTILFIIGLIIGASLGFTAGKKTEKTRVKSFEEVIQMADQTAEHQRQKLGNLEKLTAAERKQRDALKLFLKKYLPEEEKEEERER